MLAAKARTLPEKIEPTGFVRYSSVRYSYLFLTAVFKKKDTPMPKQVDWYYFRAG
jgi:hypothetical protein